MKNMKPENMLKGRIAETLIEEMLSECGNIVYRFGYESIVQNLAQVETKFDRHSEVGEKIRSIPDFIVVNRKGKPTLTEVKFRRKLELHIDDYRMLEKINIYWQAKLIFVNCFEKPYFRVSNPPYVNKGNLQMSPLIDEKEWKISKDIYKKYEELVENYLAPANSKK